MFLRNFAAANPIVMEDNLISVIVPTFNTGHLLEDCLDSILNQTYRDLEVVVTDDCSDDEDTIRILKTFERKDDRLRVFWLRQNVGAGMARNNSIRHARGRYIAFCDSDDLWMPTKLEKQMAYMTETGCCIVCSSYYKCDEDGNITAIVRPPKRISYGMLKRDNKIGCLTAIYDTKPYGKFYLPIIRKRQDWGMFLSIVRQCGYAYSIEEPLACYRIRKRSLSRNKTSLVKYNIAVYHKVLGYSKIMSCLYFFLLFLPTYFIKVLKVRIDSFIYTRQHKGKR